MKAEKSTTLLTQQLYRLILHEKNQLYGIWRDVDYIESQGSQPLTEAIVEAHSLGKETISVRLLQPRTNTSKAGCIDFDAPKDGTNREALIATLRDTQQLQQTAKNLGLPSYIEFSGRRGFHLWFFADSPVPGITWIKALHNLCQLASYKAKEIYPATETTADDGKESGRPIKLPCGIHKGSGKWSGFLTDSIEWREGFPIIPNNQEEILAYFEQIPASKIAELSFAIKENNLISNNGSKNTGNNNVTSKSANFSTLGTDEHPACIAYLLNLGAPTDQNYNSVNLTLSRYAITRGLSKEQAKVLARTMAESSIDHPTSKTTIEAKLRNFVTAYASAQRNPEDYQWHCSYIRNSQELVINGGCTGWNCPFWPWEKPSHNEAAKRVEQELIAYILRHPVEGMQEALAIELPPQGFITIFNSTGEDKKSIYLHQLIWEILVGLETQGLEIIPSLILSKLDHTLDVDNLNRTANYLDELLLLPDISPSTFTEHLLKVRDTGLRILAKEQTAIARDKLNDRTSKVSQTLDTLITHSLDLQRRSTSEILPLITYTPDLIRELFGQPSKAIATPAKWLNHALNGGFHPGRFYVIGAPPGSGKTTWCAWCADAIAAQSIPVLYVSFEMSIQQMWINALARISGINSSLIEGKKWNEPEYSHADWLKQQIAIAIQSYDRTIAEYLTILEAGAQMTTAYLKGMIAQVRRIAQLDKQAPLLVIVDYLQLMHSGDEKLDGGANEVLRVSRVATALKQLARDTQTGILAISDINKAAYQDALRTGTLDMGALRDSFKIAHAADCIMLLQTGVIKRGNESSKDQITLLEERYSDDRNKIRLLQNVRGRYPLNEKARATYGRISILKNRGGMNAEPLFVYERAYHRFQPIDLDLGELKKEELDGDI